MPVIERAARLTEIQSEPRFILKRGYSGLMIPDYPQYNVKTADLKVIIYHKWFELEDAPTIPSTFRKVMRNNSLSVLFDPITKPELPKVTYLLHHEKFPIFIANADTIDTATVGGATFQLENTTGKPIPAGRIKRFEIVPSSLGNLAPGVFDKVVEWAYTGDYKESTANPDETKILTGNRLDKKVAIASLLMGEEGLLELAIEKLRARMDAVADAKEKGEEKEMKEAPDSEAKIETNEETKSKTRGRGYRGYRWRRGRYRGGGRGGRRGGGGRGGGGGKVDSGSEVKVKDTSGSEAKIAVD